MAQLYSMMRTPGQKIFREGTHRILPPEETVDRVRPYMPAMGITRIANVTGLDRIGIPVTIVCRPNSRALSTSQGKGIDLPAAEASGLMEAVETYHGEHIVLPLKYATYEDIKYVHDLVSIDDLPKRSDSKFHWNLPILWIEGSDIVQRKSVWVPYEIVHTNYTYPMPPGSGCFVANTNGLASGNHILEAISHAICEVVERDATALWHRLSPEEQDRRRIVLETVTDPFCRELLDKFERADIAVAVWETTTDIKIPSFFCWITEKGNHEPISVQPTVGAGTHPARRIALSRALTEAAQDRLTIITGSRDDLKRTAYGPISDTLAEAQRTVFEASSTRDFEDGSSREAETLEDDVAWQIEQLRVVGIEDIIAIDLTKVEFGIPVVRVIIPGLEGVSHRQNYVPGKRALAVSGESE